LRRTHEGKKQNEELEAERQQAHESLKIPGNDSGTISEANDGVVVQHSTSFNMTLNNV
jgi:hypothetical protein